MNHNIGRALHKLRVQSGVTMAQLARSICVSRSLISQIEKGQTTPSLETLKQITKAINLSMSEFFKYVEQDSENIFEEKDIIVRKENRVIAELSGSPNKFESLTPPNGKYMEFFISVIAPRSENAKKYEFSHDGVEYVYIIRGPVELYLGKQKFVLRTGDSCCFDSSIVHCYLNPSSHNAELLCATPPIMAHPENLKLTGRYKKTGA